MNDELRKHKKSDTVKWILTLIAFALVGVLLCGIILGWFEKKETTQEPQSSAEQTGGMIVGEGEGNGIALMSAVIPLSDYDEYGISPQAKSAVTLTATVKPDNTAENTGVDWSIKWKNASSAWASGKSVTSYVTITPSGEGYAASKTVTLNNLQPFGEQIVVTATARDNPEITASCNVDYAQKLTDISLKFGDVTCNFGGRTGVTLELNQNGTPKGGKANLTQSKDSIYTIADTFSVTYKLTNPQSFLTRTPAGMPGSYPNYFDFCTITMPNYESDYTVFNGYSVAEKGLYFGIKYFIDNLALHNIQSGRGNILQYDIYTDTSVSDIITRFQNKGGSDSDYAYSSNVDLFDLTVTVQGRYSTVTKSTTFYMNGYTNASLINAMGVSQSSVIF
ncbi:MAG: hypothetical protein NC548_35495 [Lachnospiraceae bacterium]|nr:hypothetical protein [Lachnospiraceae bacterium]